MSVCALGGTRCLLRISTYAWHVHLGILLALVGIDMNMCVSCITQTDHIWGYLWKPEILGIRYLSCASCAGATWGYLWKPEILGILDIWELGVLGTNWDYLWRLAFLGIMNLVLPGTTRDYLWRPAILGMPKCSLQDK